jgi:shikimate dehydrogenase
MDTYGLIGKKLGHSFSKAYFEKKFKSQQINAQYLNFELDEIGQLKNIIKNYPELVGLNVTIPFKKSVMDFIDQMDEVAEKVGSVNTLKIDRSGNEIFVSGYNTDVIGFEETLKPLLADRKSVAALILGTGGASNAVAFVLAKLGIPHVFVSRAPENSSHISYKGLTPEMVKSHKLIINTSPVGMYPSMDEAPDIPYTYLGEDHILYDLIYNPEETLFLNNGREKGATTMNGLKMLELQAEASWNIWHSFEM